MPESNYYRSLEKLITELKSLLSEKIPINRKIIRTLINEEIFERRWDYFGFRNDTNFFGTQKDWNQTLITLINELSAQIHKATLRGGVKWIACSAEVGAIFDDLECLHLDGSFVPESEKNNFSIDKISNLGNRYVVYKTTNFPAHLVLLGDEDKKTCGVINVDNIKFKKH